MSKQQPIDYQVLLDFYNIGRGNLQVFKILNEAEPDIFEYTDQKLKLLCEALELTLKGWLAFKGKAVVTDKSLHVHDLVKLFELVIEEYGTYFEGRLEDIVFLNKYYSIKAYQYPLKERQIGYINEDRLKQLEHMIANFQDKLIKSILAAKAKQ